MIIMRITGTFDFIVMIIMFLTNYIILCHYNILLGHFPILRQRGKAGGRTGRGGGPSAMVGRRRQCRVVTHTRASSSRCSGSLLTAAAATVFVLRDFTESILHFPGHTTVFPFQCPSRSLGLLLRVLLPT